MSNILDKPLEVRDELRLFLYMSQAKDCRVYLGISVSFLARLAPIDTRHY